VDCSRDVGGEVKIWLPSISTIPGNLDNFMESRLEDRQRVGLPCRDARLTQVDDGDADVRVLFGDDGARRAALYVLSSEESRGRIMHGSLGELTT